MGKRIRYTDEFKRDAVAQVKERGYSVKDVSERLGICTKSMYDWIGKFHEPEPLRADMSDQAQENRRLRAELSRVTEERDILKKATVYFAKQAK
jgi:transposase